MERFRHYLESAPGPINLRRRIRTLDTGLALSNSLFLLDLGWGKNLSPRPLEGYTITKHVYIDLTGQADRP
jgi:hypothetical protein